MNLDACVQTLSGIDIPSQMQPRTFRSRINTQVSHPQIVEQSLFRAADLQFPAPLSRPHIVFHKHLARHLFQRIGKQPLHGVEDDIHLDQVVGQSQLLDGAADREPPLVGSKQPLFFRIEELKVELAGLDKVDGYTVRLGAGPHASAEKAVYRRGEGGFEGRGRHGQCSCEAPVFLFLGGTDQVVPAEDGPVRICQLGAFASKALDDMVKPRILLEQNVSNEAAGLASTSRCRTWFLSSLQ